MAAIDTYSNVPLLKGAKETSALLRKLATVDDGLVRHTRRELIYEIRTLIGERMVLGERFLFPALRYHVRAGELIGEYHATAERIGGLLTTLAGISPRLDEWTDALAELRARVGALERQELALLALAEDALGETAYDDLRRRLEGEGDGLPFPAAA
jgi:hypothetical protein